jgi:hypothetical protein
MEVASIFTSNADILKLFEEFIYGYSELKLSDKDGDTAYFKSKEIDKYEIYYHFKLDNVKEEFAYNYSPKDVAFIKGFFKGNEIFLIDISFKSRDKLYEMMNSFKVYLSSRYKEAKSELILSDPFKGLIMFDIGKAPLKYSHLE